MTKSDWTATLMQGLQGLQQEIDQVVSDVKAKGAAVGKKIEDELAKLDSVIAAKINEKTSGMDKLINSNNVNLQKVMQAQAQLKKEIADLKASLYQGESSKIAVLDGKITQNTNAMNLLSTKLSKLTQKIQGAGKLLGDK